MNSLPAGLVVSKGSGGRPERDSGGVEVVDQGGQVADAAAEPVEPVDQ
jgi:hypothetical protein